MAFVFSDKGSNKDSYEGLRILVRKRCIGRKVEWLFSWLKIRLDYMCIGDDF